MAMLIRSTAFAALIALGCSSAAFAQAEQSQRAFRGLFGGPAPSPDSSTQADLDVSLFGAYDTDIAAAQGASTVSQNNDAGGYAGMNVGATFTQKRRHFNFGLSGGSSAQYYPTLHSMTSLGDQVAASLGFSVGHRVSIGLMESATYSPLFMLAPFATPVASNATEVAPSPISTAVLHETVFGYSTGVNASVALGPRWSVASNAVTNTSTVQYPFGSVTQHGWSAGASLHRQITQASGFHLGYTQQVISYPGTPQFRLYNLDLGMDYHKALGPTRRTTMSFSFGSGMAQDAGSHLYSLLGDASINREIGRSWVAQATYNRGFGMLAGFSRPYFSDSVSGSVGGLITRRVDLSIGTAYTNGQIGITQLTNSLNGLNSSARVRYAISQLFAVYGQYLVYWYDLANNLYVATALPPNVLRQGVNVGLSLNLPLVR